MSSHVFGSTWVLTPDRANFADKHPFLVRTQSANPALASIIRKRRTQVLPVQWRASLKLDEQHNEEDERHGMDNRFSMAGTYAVTDMGAR